MNTTIKALIGGSAAFFLAMGVSRFAFTPFLPVMQTEFQFSDTVAGGLASANYLGYLIGAVMARFLPSKIKYTSFVVSVVLCILFVALMCLPFQNIWYFARFFSGVFSALVFIITSELIFSYLEKISNIQLGGIIFSGIGAGMVFSGIIIPVLSRYFNSFYLWLWLAFFSIIPMLSAILWVPKNLMRKKEYLTSVKVKKIDIKLILLSISYFLEGFAYIIFGTFISLIIYRTTNSLSLSSYVWVFAGAGAIFITPLWLLLSKRIGVQNVLILAFIVQIAAISAPMVSSNVFLAKLAAIGFGGTFLGITSTSLAYGRKLDPDGETTSFLTILFSLGQISGPIVAGYISDFRGSFTLSLLIASLSAAIACFLIFIIRFQKD